MIEYGSCCGEGDLEGAGIAEKTLKKSFEKGLTKAPGCGRINKLSPNGAADGSLKIEQQRCTKDSENSFEFKKL